MVLGVADSGPTAILFAAIQPDRTQGLILANTAARFGRDDNYPLGPSQGEATALVEALAQRWGSEDLAALASPDAARDPAFADWMARSMRLAMTGKDASDYMRVVATHRRTRRAPVASRADARPAP